MILTEVDSGAITPKNIYNIGHWWLLQPSSWGQGFVTEVAGLMVNIAKSENVKRIHAVVNENNHRGLYYKTSYNLRAQKVS
jgi:RimJ/RimL family protein N-acetyltransferase